MPRRDEFDDDRRPDDWGDDQDRRADREPGPERPRKRGRSTGAILGITFWIVLLCGGCLVGGAVYGLLGMRDDANRMKSSNNLRQIGLAIHNYGDTYGGLPGNTYTEEGKPLLSWRVHILPFIGQDNLWKQFKLDEPWDSPNNRPLLGAMPRVYMLPSAPTTTPPGFTHYRGFSSPGTVFDHRPSPNRNLHPVVAMLNFGNLQDGTSYTALVVEAADPVEWTRPDDLDISPDKPVPQMGSFYRRNRFNLLLADGTVRTLRQDMPESVLRALATHNGRETLPPGWDKDQ